MRRSLPRLALFALFLPVQASAEEPLWHDPVGKPPAIKLLEKGQEPLAVLRWKHVKGKSERARLTVEEGVDSGRHGKRNHKAVASLTGRVEDVTRTLDARCAYAYEDFEWATTVDFASAPKESWSTWSGSKAHLTVTAQGFAKNAERTPAKSAKHEIGLSSALFALGTGRPPPFPTEPVGVGARWQVSGKHDATWTIEEVTTCMLKARDGDRLTVEVSVTQTAKPQKNRSEGTVTQLLLYSGSGTGTFDLDLTCVLPVAANSSVAGDERTNMSVKSADYAFDVETKHAWKMTLTALPPETTPR